MSAEIVNTTADAKVKKITLAGKYTKFMVFGHWFIQRLNADEAIAAAARDTLLMFASPEEQNQMFDLFFNELKTSTTSLPLRPRRRRRRRTLPRKQPSPKPRARRRPRLSLILRMLSLPRSSLPRRLRSPLAPNSASSSERGNLRFPLTPSLQRRRFRSRLSLSLPRRRSSKRGLRPLRNPRRRRQLL